ncbi:MAG: MBL fold metallo-hydrolase [Acidobacteriota bacterium]|nr:MBL fold metallo-hydrolase [Acidobacteriota bacterium]
MLGSGSAGNATLLQHGDQRVLIDVGLSYREVVRRLEHSGVSPDSVRAVVITHAHGDHVRGAALFSRRHEVPVHTTAATRAVWGDITVSSWCELVCGTIHSIGDFRFEPFEVSHDADAETVAFRIDTPAGPIGFATDVGVVTHTLRDRFQSCRALVMESNHATDLLLVGPYASSTKARIGGARGHLSNEALASFLRNDLGSSVECVVLAHLSRVNNLPELAELTCREALDAAGRADVRIVVTGQDRVTETVELDDRLAAFQHRAPPAHQAALPF